MARILRGGLALAVLGLASCGGGDGDPVDAAVPDARYSRVDSFDDCHVGLHFADCGDGPGAPVLGCEADDGDCRWFTTGAVPLEVEHVSDCPPDDICCHQDWPFAGADGIGAYALFDVLDDAPWDRARAMDLTVTIDPALTAPVTPDLMCEGTVVASAGAGPCETVEGVLAYALDTPAVGVFGPSDFYGWYPVIELDEPTPGQLRARVCAHQFTDVLTNQCDANTAICATSGTITLDQWPLPSTAGAVLRLDATFASGARLTGDVAITTVRTGP